MKRSPSDRLAPAVFIVSVAVLGIVYGTVSSWWGWFPAPQIGLAHRTMLDLQKNWRNDLGLEPTRHLVAPDDSGAAPDPDRGFALHDGGAAAPGYTLVAGLSDDQETSVHAAWLFDSEGNEVHRWPIRYASLDETSEPQNVMLHGMEVFPDGSLALTFDAGNTVARIDACGERIWSTAGRYHHTLNRDGAGMLMTWRDDTIVWIDEETGEEVRALDLRKEVVHARDGEQQGYLDIRTRTPETAAGRLRYMDDPFHPNDVEPLRAEMAAAFPMFETGDLLISLRELNLVAVLDPETGALKWWHHGPWLKQHDPDFQPDGTITVYDNATGTGSSKIRRIDPADDTVTLDFAGSGEVPFYSWRRGKHQYLPNGNILLSEPEHGRVLEVDAAGKLVWDRHMVWDAEHNLIVTEARHIPEDYFSDGALSCATDMAAAAP